MADREARGWLYPVMAAVAGFVAALPFLILARGDLARTRVELARAQKETESAGAFVVRLDAAGTRIAVPQSPVAFEVDAEPGRVILRLDSGGRAVARHELVVTTGKAALLVAPKLLRPGDYRLGVEVGAATHEFPIRVE